MPRFLHIKPAKGLKVRDPITRQPLPVEGAKVEGSTYWRKRIREGDAIRLSNAEAKEWAANRKKAEEERQKEQAKAKKAGTDNNAT